MDNLTHSLIGLVAGDLASRVTRPRTGGLTAEQRRVGFIALAAIGGNLPDLDLLVSYQGFTGDKIGYLLEHRGYTHTILGCLMMAALLYAGAELWARIKRISLGRGDRMAFAAMAVVGVMLHLGMDALNSYGVHPFWPVNNGWVYGDSVFIIEPLYWLATAPMFFLVRSVGARVIVALVVLAGLAAYGFAHAMDPLSISAAALITVGLFAVGKLASPRAASFTSGAVMAGVTAMFMLAGQAATHRAEALAASHFPGEKNVDHVLSPLPANPFCWDLLLVQTEGGRYTVRHGTMSNAPGWIPASACPRIFPRTPTGTALMTAVPGPTSPDVDWVGEFSMPVERLGTLAHANCEAYEVLQFARAPFVTSLSRERWVIGDLRFDRVAALEMSEIELSDPPPASCRYDVPWIPPRAELLSADRLPPGTD